MKIRLLKKSEIKSAVKLIRSNFEKGYHPIVPHDIKAMFGGPGYFPAYLVAVENNVIVGLGGVCESWMDTNTVEIFWINVKKDRQQRGIGKTIIAELLKLAKRKKYSLVLLSTLMPAYYQKLGFKILYPITKGYVVMGKHLG